MKPAYFQNQNSGRDRWMVSYLDVLTDHADSVRRDGGAGCCRARPRRKVRRLRRRRLH